VYSVLANSEVPFGDSLRLLTPAASLVLDYQRRSLCNPSQSLLVVAYEDTIHSSSSTVSSLSELEKESVKCATERFVNSQQVVVIPPSCTHFIIPCYALFLVCTCLL